MKVIKHLFSSVILAGVIILMIGLYYAMLKAGIPYQDPTPELQIQYTVNLQIGEILTAMGFGMLAFGVIARVVAGVIDKRISKQ